jgi:aryl-alcohol dehydrogenase-like predicted oxidoreductase
MTTERSRRHRTLVIPKRMLGRTGVQVSAIGIGGFHLGKPEERAAIRLVHAAIDRGVTFLDNCWDYNDGVSELRMGKALRYGHRSKVFLMTKIDGRTKMAAATQIEQSLDRLQTEVIDLVQIHEVIREDDPARCFAEHGAIAALIEAKKAGKIRFIGFTGHKSARIHVAMLEMAESQQFAFDTVQLPLNVVDHHAGNEGFEALALPAIVRHGAGVLGMKSMADGKIVKGSAVTGAECLRYALSLPTSVVITGCENDRDLDQAIAAATAPSLTEAEKAAILAKSEPLAKSGDFEPYKNTKAHDGTDEHPHWLESATI